MPRDTYDVRLNRVMDYVRSHATEALPLARLAAIAGFSPYHFHRLFTSLSGETVAQFVRRARLERAVALMKAAPDFSLTRVALDCGFSSPSDFSRAFKDRYGMAPKSWNRRSPLTESKIRQADDPCRHYGDEELEAAKRRGEFTVQVRPLPERRVAFIRIADSYTVANVLRGYGRLIRWLKRRSGTLPAGALIGLSHDDPEVTPPKQCRYDFCYTVGDDVAAEGEIGVRVLPACTVASLRVDGDIRALVRGWDYLFRLWLPRSRYVPANLPAMEVYRRTPEVVGWEWFDLDACVPVESMGGSP